MEDHILVEDLAYHIWHAYVLAPVYTSIGSASFLWLCIALLSLPFQFLFLFLLAMVSTFRLALANANRVIFVFASSILSFYQVPRKAFYIYIAVLVVTGFLQFLRIDSKLRIFLLLIVDTVTIGKSNLFLRKFTGLHFSNPYTRTHIDTQTIFFPVGHIVPDYSNMEVFRFPVSPNLDFFKKEVVVGNCTITIKTLEGSIPLEECSTVRLVRVKAPWGDNTVTFSMEDENLGRFASYLEHLKANECKQVICIKSRNHGPCRALTIAETIEYFNRGLSLVKLELRHNDFYFIY